MKARSTLHFTSDGTNIYWLYTVTPPAADKDKEKNKQEQVCLETLIVKVLIDMLYDSLEKMHIFKLVSTIEETYFNKESSS